MKGSGVMGWGAGRGGGRGGLQKGVGRLHSKFVLCMYATCCCFSRHVQFLVRGGVRNQGGSRLAVVSGGKLFESQES